MFEVYMKKEITPKATKGQTVKEIIFSIHTPQMIISFTDNTFICFWAEKDYTKIDIIPAALDLFSFGDEKLCKGGIISQKELAVERARYNSTLEKERKEYKRLKLKFEGKL